MQNLKKIFSLVLTIGMLFIPIVSFAQTPRSCSDGGMIGLICKIGELLNYAMPVLISLGVVLFIWGVVLYVIGGGDEAKTKGRDRILWGLGGLTIMSALWGLVNMMLKTFGLNGNQNSIPDGLNSLIPTGTIEACSSNGGITLIICNVSTILSKLIPLLISVGVIIFIWGVVLYVIGGGDEAKTKGRDRMLWGLVGLAVIAGMWGLVAMINTTFGITDGSDVANTFIQSNKGFGGQTAGGGCEIGNDKKLQGLLNFATCVLTKSMVPLLVAMATVAFVWGIIMYVISGGDENKKDKGREYIMWGLIGLTVMVSVWGLVKILGTTFGIDHAIPQVQKS
ncbi:MAG: pilin [Candidatus Pacebacteria bacterium]|nr:pilin [Candidatus Paceibacterota bacterium]MCF7862991.1 pilin [Candidatus Paceibacterota bacterium]